MVVAERERLEQTITALEAQRAVLGDAVVNTTVAALRERLVTLQPDAVQPERKQVTLLLADLSGFTAMASTLDAEEVQVTMNALWQRLDRVIGTWGGRVDKHLGDGMLALFGVPLAREDDPECAVAAALEMQQALTAFNRERPEAPQLSMRIGVHTGWVLLGPVGSGEEYTATGRAVAIAGSLEKNAPIGEVLISQAVFRHIEGLFTLSPYEPLALSDRQVLPTFRVRRALSRRALPLRRRIEGIETRMIGRDLELEALQAALKEVVVSDQAQIFTVVGEAGIGKSRLRHEFKQWVRANRQGLLLEGRADQQTQRLPYSLLRDLIIAWAGRREDEPVELTRAGLVAAVRDVLLSGNDSALQAEKEAHFIAHLIGFDFSDSPYLKGIVKDAPQIRQRAFMALLRFFEALARRQRPLILVVEDVHWMDEGSLDFALYLLRNGLEAPFFMLGLTRPSLFERQPQWGHHSQTVMPYTQLDLPPLSATDSRRLVAEILRKVPEIPSTLLDLICEGAGGNPFYVEEIIKVLIEEGTIEKGPEIWRVAQHEAELRVPTTLTGVLQARLDRLPAVQRHVLQRAAVVGRLFWDSAVAATGEEGPAALAAALASLEAREFIFKRRTTTFTGVQEYTFKHAILREVTYESVLLQQRRHCHRRVAAWLIDQAGARADEYAGLIAEHYDLAGDKLAAAHWYGRAGRQARVSYSPETAIRYYRKALSYLATEPVSAGRRVELYGGLGEMLRWQARFGEAVEALEEMRIAAEQANDHEAQTEAWINLFLAQNYQGEHRAALESATGAERVARTTEAPVALATALSAKGWALMFLGETERAFRIGQEALALAEETGDRRTIAYCHTLLGGTYRMQQKYEASERATRQALLLFQQLGDRIWEGQMLHNLGQTARLRGDYEAAHTHYWQAIAIGEEIGDRYGMMTSYSRLGRVARLQGAYRKAETHFREALALAEKSRNRGRQAYNARELGDLHLEQALLGAPGTKAQHLQQAGTWFDQARQLATAAEQPVTEAAALNGLAQVSLFRDRPDDAFSLVSEALQSARLQVALWQGVAAQKVAGTAWRIMGNVVSRLPEDRLPLVVDDEVLDPVDCFSRSLEIWDEIGSGVQLERARTLRDWAVYEASAGRAQEARPLQQEAMAIFSELQMMSEVSRLEMILVEVEAKQPAAAVL